MFASSFACVRRIFISLLLFFLQGRVKDEGSMRLKTLLQTVADKYGLTMVLSPSQSVIIKDIPPR